MESKINLAQIKSFEEAIDFKYEIQKELVDFWFSHEISTERFMYLLTLMYEKIMNELIPIYFLSNDICVVGFGKIGAYEINFSSDIDVCFVFASGQDEEEIIKNTRRFILETTQKKQGRFIWRLDIDLRPGGKSSPVAVSDAFFTWYYLNLGKVDDRYALLRARPIGGKKEIGDRILEEISPFIFRKYLDFSVIERLKEIKVLISRHIKATEEEFDVKYSHGGIREIEFVAFANQLIFGGKDKRFRAKKTTEILELVEKEILKTKYDIPLKDCYIFLREIESIIQLDEEYRFNLTEKDIERILNFYRIGRKEFFEKLELVRKIVSDTFKKTFDVEEPEYRIFSEETSDKDIKEYLISIGYRDAESSLNIVKSMMQKTSFLKEKKRVFMYDQEISETINPERIVSAIVWYCSQFENPDETLSLLSHFISSVGKKRGIYVMLFKNEKLLKTLAELMSRSTLLANFLIKHPESIDTIFLQERREKISEDEFWNRIKDFEVEEALDEIRREKREKMIITILDDISEKLDIDEVSRRINEIYDFVLRETVSLTAREKLGKKSPPSSLDIPFVVIAFGKYGSEEAIYGSDADIFFSFYDENDFEKWLKFAQKFLTFVTAKTKEGEGLQIDMRLRPSGRAGPIALSKKAITSFYTETDKIWEIFPLIKVRTVFDGYGKYNKFLAELKEKAFSRFPYEKIRDEMVKIRDKSYENLGKKIQDDKILINLKYCKGGMYDFELIIGLNQIKEKMLHIGFKEAIREICRRFDGLEKSYKTLRKIEKYVKIRSDLPPEDIWIPQSPDDKFWKEIEKYEGINYDEFKNATETISKVFEESI